MTLLEVLYLLFVALVKKVVFVVCACASPHKSRVCDTDHNYYVLSYPPMTISFEIIMY